MMEHFARNLAYLCSHFDSVAETCRRIGINRQQFNKYLAGQSHPSRATMRRLCDFFGVTESEILLQPDEFRGLFELRSRATPETQLTPAHQRALEVMRLGQERELQRYAGYYFRYFYTFSQAGLITRSLGVMAQTDGIWTWKNLERQRANEPGMSGETTVAKFVGVVMMLANRIYVIEVEAMNHHSVTQMILYPSYRSHIGMIRGIQTGGPIRRGRKPSASAVMLQYLGRDIDLRKALAQTGHYAPDDPRLPPGTAEAVANRIGPDQMVLEID